MTNYYRIKGVGASGVEEFSSRREAERFARAVVRGLEPGARLSVQAARLIGLPSDPSSYIDGWRTIYTAERMPSGGVKARAGR